MCHNKFRKGGFMNDLPQLIEKEIPRLRKYAHALFRGEAADAEDLVQETLMRALSRTHLFQPGTDVSAWLFTIMHNSFVNMVRRAVREWTALARLNPDGVVTERTVSDKLTLRDLGRGMENLPDQQRLILLLVGVEGMRYEEVAEVLCVPVGTVRLSLSRAREYLRELCDV